MLDAAAAWQKLLDQFALGPRFCGSPGHAQAHRLLAQWLARADVVREHTFTDVFFGKPVACRNLWGRFEGDQPGRLLLGSHFDTRPWADEDLDPARRQDPVLGANDGASGVALLAQLAQELVLRRDRPSVDLVFFDAEDWHGIDGHTVSEGSRRFVADLDTCDRPDALLVVDMVAGRDLVLDVDVSGQEHTPSRDLVVQLFSLGRTLGLPAFSLAKPHPYKSIGCDHSPFVEADIPGAILIDIDYPPWHTVGDVPQACDPQSLAQMATLLDAFVFGRLSPG